MTRTQTVTVTTNRTSNKVLRRDASQRPARISSTKTRLGLSSHHDKRTVSRYNSRQKPRSPMIRASVLAKQATTARPNDQARRKSSSGSSSNPTGSSFSDGESSRNNRSTLSNRERTTQDSTGSRSLSSDVNSDSIVERNAQALPGSFPKSPRRRRTLKITIGTTFAGSGASKRRRPGTVAEARKKAHLAQSRARNDELMSNTAGLSSPKVIRKPSNSQIVRLSPRSLRRARLMVLDKKRDLSSSSLLPELESDRRGSTLLPRQHYCEPDIRGHHSAPDQPKSVAEIRTKHSSGSPNPDSPGGNKGSAPPAQDHPGRLQKPRWRIANMRVADIVRLTTEEPCSFEIIPTAGLSTLPLDQVTKARIAELVASKPGSTLVGIGPWMKLVSCGESLIWNNWCCLSRGLVVEADVSLVGLLDGQHLRQEPRDEVVLVPLTNSQTASLKQALGPPVLDVKEKREP